MQERTAKILLTGPPGCGKTTAIIQIMENLKSVKAAGFYTKEIRQDNTRKGFGWTRLDGDTTCSASFRSASSGTNLRP